MQHEIPELDQKGLRRFGLTTGAILAGLFGVLFPWLFGRPWPYWPWAVAAVLGGWAVVAPASMRGFYRLWMRFAVLLSRITTPVIMGLVFFLVITPFGLAMRLISRDPMARRFDPSAESYRIPSRNPAKTHMEKPF